MIVPKTLGACADKLYKLRSERIELSARVDKIKKQESEIKDYLIRCLPKSKAEGVIGRLANAKITKKIVGTVEDWPKFYAYVLRKKDFSLLQRRLSSAAVVEYWEDGKKIPGVVPYTIINVSVTKR